MDTSTAWLLIGAAVITGMLIGGYVARARADRSHARATAALQVRVATAEAGHDAALDQAEQYRVQLRDHLAQARSDQAAREERDRRDNSVLRALEPVREALTTMNDKVVSLERDRQQQYGTLAEQLRRSHESDEALRATTESLAGALRSTATRGVWGETQLRRVVEAAGMTKHVDFTTQEVIHTDAGTGRPDMVVRLPGGKALAVDAKVPLDAYLDASAIPVTARGADAERRTRLLAQHVKAVRAHVDSLAKKKYWDGIGASPEFVICFLPTESLLSAALEDDPSLLDYAFSQRVALASPVNLWAVLKTVAYTWTQEDVSADARELVALGRQLYGRLGSLAGHADELRRGIQRTVDGYNKLVGSLESRVLVTARRFPGVDESNLSALEAPTQVESAPRKLTADEFTLTADVGDLRERLSEPESRKPIDH